MRCPNCKAENDHARQLCKECGTSLVIICPRCSTENHQDNKFCSECGVNLTSLSEPNLPHMAFEEKLKRIQKYLPRGVAEKVLEQKDKIEGEIKQVTVMFCDLAGFTPLVENVGIEEAYSVMGQVYEILIHRVHKYDGTVNEMTGDGIMALFGAPIALEDAPQRALWSALSIHRELDRFNEKHQVAMPLKMRIGVHTGPVVVGTLGNDLRVEFKAVGDTVNMASRIENIAEPGTCYVTEETFRQTKGLFRFDALGDKQIKGKLKTTPVYKVLSSKEDVYRPRLGSERMIYSKMVGRDVEFGTLELQVMKAIRGNGSVINIIGEAGIGKSRLLAELKKREVMKKVILLEGRAISIGRNLSFHPIIDLFKQWAQISEDDGEATVLGKLEALVRRVYSEGAGEVIPFVATLMGMKISGRYAERVKGIEGEPLEKLILKNVRELLIKVAESIPLVMVFEDLHWADASSIKLLESLFRLAESQRIVFVNVFRPGHKETGDEVIKTIKERLPVYHVEIFLDRLNERMSQALITNILKISGIHYAITTEIIERAGGNPFFIEEVVRSLIDESAIIIKDGKFKLTERIDRVSIPNSIHDVLMARIDRLDEETRNLVKVASVIGRNFFYKVLSDVATTTKDLDRKLSYLKEIQIIRERKRMGEIEYLFKHTLAQEAVYESMLPQKRHRLHLNVATSIEKVFSERLHEFYGMLAYHYSKAENIDKTEEYLVKAGEEALKSSASNEALHYYQKGLSLYSDKYSDSAEPQKIAIFEKNIALALYNKGQCEEEAVEYFEKALNYYWGKIPRHSISALMLFVSAFFQFAIALYLPSFKFKKTPTKNDIEAIDLFYKKCRVLSIIDAKAFFFESLYFFKGLTRYAYRELPYGIGIFAGASALFSFSGLSFRISRKVLDSIQNRISKNDDKQLLLYEVFEKLHDYLEGSWLAIKEHDDELINRNLDLGEIFTASHLLFWHGLPCIYKGRLDIAKTMVNRLNDIYNIYENDLSILLKQLLNTSFLLECRRLNEALIEIENGIDFGDRTNQRLSLIHMFSCKAFIQILMGDIEAADNSLAQAEKNRREVSPAPWQLSNFYKSRVKYDLHRLEDSIVKGDKSVFFDYRNKALRSCKTFINQSKKVAQHRTESLRQMGVYYWLLKRQNKAVKWWNMSIEAGERLGARLDLSRTFFEIGKRSFEQKSKYKVVHGIQGEEYLDKAKELFKEMNLQWDLDELDRLVVG